MNENEHKGDSRRSFMAKGALATGALALGTSAFGTATVGAQQEQIAVFATNYHPGADFDVIAQLETSTTVDVLRDDDETVDEISQPDEWTGHIIRYDLGTEDSGITTFLFLREGSLSAGDSGTMGGDASVLSSDLNLLTTSVGGRVDDGDGFDDDDDGDGDEIVEEEEIGDDDGNGDEIVEDDLGDDNSSNNGGD